MADLARSNAALEVPTQPASRPVRIPARAKDVVFAFSFVSWQAAEARGWCMPEDRLARALVSHERVERLLVCDLARSLPAKLLRDAQSRGRPRFPSDASTQLVSPVRLRRNYPIRSGAVEHACADYERKVSRAARRLGLATPSLITTNPLLAGFADFEWARSVTFYATDDWLAYPPHRRWRRAYEESFERMRARRRRVVAVSAPLLERLAPTGASAVVANGLDPAEWHGPATPPDWLHELPRPWLVYVGTLDSRLDTRALLAIASNFPGASVVLIGPIVEPRHLAVLRSTPNIHIHPRTPRPEALGAIRAADVGLIPHRELALTQAMSPLKLYEYLAAGLPVVATDLVPMRGVDDSVALVSDRNRFPATVREALARGRASEARRARFIEENSWSARHQQILDVALA